MSDLKAMLKERDRMLRTLDVEAAKMQLVTQEGFRNPSDLAVLISLHKARYECTSIGDSYRHESAKWLRERGYKRMDMSPLLPEGVLPA